MGTVLSPSRGRGDLAEMQQFEEERKHLNEKVANLELQLEESTNNALEMQEKLD